MAKVTLAALVAATASAGYLYATEKDAKDIVAAGYAEVGAANPDNPKEFAIRATPAGVEAHNAASQPAPATEMKSSFEFMTGTADELAATKRKSGRASKYPFADFPAPTLDANGNVTNFAKIFVPATDKMPNPVKSLSSTVSAANRQFAKVVGTKPGKNRKGEEIQKNIYEFTRKFEIVPGEHNGQNGAFIRRVA